MIEELNPYEVGGPEWQDADFDERMPAQLMYEVHGLYIRTRDALLAMQHQLPKLLEKPSHHAQSFNLKVVDLTY